MDIKSKHARNFMTTTWVNAMASELREFHAALTSFKFATWMQTQTRFKPQPIAANINQLVANAQQMMKQAASARETRKEKITDKMDKNL